MKVREEIIDSKYPSKSMTFGEIVDQIVKKEDHPD